MLKYILILILIVFSTTGCETTKYVERQSEELSRSVYATKDSLDNARLDLAEKYVLEATRIVKPPKQRIKIDPFVESNEKGTEVQRVLVVPNSNKNDKVVVVGTIEYEKLLKNKEIAEQLKKDVYNWSTYSEEVDRKLMEQYEIQDEMIIKIQTLEKTILQKDKKLLQKDLTILWKNIIIVSLIGVFGVSAYLRIKGIL